MPATSTVSSLLALPDELVQNILTYLEPLDLANVAQTCRNLSTVSYDDGIWQPLVNRNLLIPTSHARPLKSFRELYLAHEPYWFVPRHRIWFADSEPGGKLLVSRYNPDNGSIEAHAVVATRAHTTRTVWEADGAVIIHNFKPRVALHLHQPVLKLDVDSPRTQHQPNNKPSDRGHAPSSRYSTETLMETFSEPGLYSSFMLCRPLPEAAISENSKVWPPLSFPAQARVRNQTSDGFNSSGHRPSRHSEVSSHHFRLRKWVEYTGRHSSPTSFTSPNGLAAVLGITSPHHSNPYHSGPYASASPAPSPGINIRMPEDITTRMPEDITTYATLPPASYTPTPAKPWQGIWVGDYSGHGCEFLLIRQPDAGTEAPLPDGMAWLAHWFRHGSGTPPATSTASSPLTDAADDDDAFAFIASFPSDDNTSPAAPPPLAPHLQPPPPATNDDDPVHPPPGRLEAIKLTGDPNIPRGQYTFIAPDVGAGGFVRVADEPTFRGARIVRSAGHIAAAGFREDQYTPSQLIMISHDRLAQYWEDFGHISYFQRVDVDALVRTGGDGGGEGGE